MFCFHNSKKIPAAAVAGGVAIVNFGPVQNDNTAANSCTLTLPTGLVNGNLLFMVLANANAGTASLAGWTFINANDTVDYVTAYRVIDGTEGTTVTVNYNFALKTTGIVYQISGQNATPIGTHSTNSGSGTSATHAGIVTTAANSLVIAACVGTGVSVGAVSGAGGFVADGDASAGLPFGYESASKTQATAAACGAVAFALGGSVGWRVSMYEIKAA